MAIRTYLWIITLNINGLNSQPKDADWLNVYKNKTHMCAVYKKPTSDLKTHMDWKWEDGKYIPCKWEAKESWSRNPHIKQNRP